MAGIEITVIWVASCFLCFYITSYRGVKVGAMMRLLAVVLGPLAIPFAFFLGKQ